MNLTAYEQYVDSFTGKAIEGFQLKPYHSALFCKGTIVAPTTTPINGTHNFQVDLEIDISAKTPKLTVKRIELTS